MRLRRQALITIPRLPGEPISPFTPEGERPWATDGWDPRYADPSRTDGVGTVFTTEHGGRRKVWVIVDRSETSIRYARVSADEAGTVEVTVQGDAPAVGAPMSVSVGYELTALTPDGARSIALFAAQYDDEIGAGEREIRAAIAAGAFDRVGGP